ncbi:MAG: sarcosine oxidase subunit gamma [Sphingomonas sp.]|uniref:sarcosine oxidase subunit gamma n=1 Tax=Sphingomonas sp. TaxID=28214 RepID=UPI0035A9A47B|nr:sarcosine oxidase subunit gamma [Sphingomonas sp.]
MAERVTVTERTGLGIATVMQRQGASAPALSATIGCPLPEGPRRTTMGPLSMIGTGPGSWLAMMDDAPADWAETLQPRLAGLASVSDQSGGYLVHRFAGAGASGLLQRGVAIDLHPAAFPTGSVAATVIAHIGVILWRVDYDPSFDVAIFRSYADSFRHWIGATQSGLPHDQ